MVRARDKFYLDNPELRTPWIDAEGREITPQSLGSAVYAAREHADMDGYFYLTDEKNGFTIFHVALVRFEMRPVTARCQFKDERDAAEIARLFALQVVDADLVADAEARDKGYNAAAIQLHKRNKSRAGSIQEYREKMKARQIPLKLAEQWDFFVRMIEDGQLTAKALNMVLAYAEDTDRIKNGEAGEAFDANEERRVYMENAVKG